MNRTISLLLALILVICAIPMFATSASAVCRCPCWPELSDTAYCEFKADKQILCWNDPNLTVRGTISPYKSYNAYISKGDICKIVGFRYNYLIVKYPTASGERTAYIHKTALFNVITPREFGISKGKAITYSNKSGAVYGSTAKNDSVYVCYSYGDYKMIMYTAVSGNRKYKLGYVTASDYNSIIRGLG